MRYMLMFFADEDEWMTLSQEERQAAVGQIGEWYGRQAQTGKIVEGRRLFGKDRARTVRLGQAGRSSKAEAHDGPFIEAKEAIGSYCIVEAADLDEATAIAQSWPGGGAVEIRPVMEG